jgi:hypothetical protein
MGHPKLVLLPAAGLHELGLFNGGGGEAFHGAGDGFAGSPGDCKE